jgi:hypothetical protein
LLEAHAGAPHLLGEKADDIVIQCDSSSHILMLAPLLFLDGGCFPWVAQWTRTSLAVKTVPGNPATMNSCA